MSERVSGDPEVLDAYTDRTLPSVEAVAEAVHEVEAAREAFVDRQAALAATGHDIYQWADPHPPRERMGRVLEALEIIDRQPASFAFALRQVDADLRDLARGAGHRFDVEDEMLSADDDGKFDRLAATYLESHLIASAEAGSSSAMTATEVAALVVAGVGQAARRNPEDLGELVANLSERTSGQRHTPPRGTWQKVPKGFGPLGLVLTGAGDLQHTGNDELATTGQRASSAIGAVAFEGGGSTLGALAGGAAGQALIPVPILGAAVGGIIGAAAGGRGGRKLREADPFQRAEDALAEGIDAIAGTEREPDRYDGIMDRVD